MGKALRIAFLICLVLTGCQPYPDHGDPIPDFRANSIDFGTRRELKLVRFEGDEKGLLLQFNQPIQKLSEWDDPVPFELSFVPQIPLRNLRREGAASVRVEFAEELPPAHTYKATIPVGWRALTGASFLRSRTVEWTTMRPALVKVEPVPGEAAWKMIFNQPINAESLTRCLEVPGLSSEDYDIVPLDPTRYELRILTPVALASLGLSPGLESKVGKVQGLAQDFSLTEFSAGVFFCEKSEWLPEVGAVRLLFSEQVSRSELLQNLQGLELPVGHLYSDDGKDFLLFLGDVSRAREISVSDSLTALSGSHLLHDVRVTVSPLHPPTSQESYRSPRSLDLSATVLRMPTAEETNVAAWRLDRESAIALVALSDEAWSDPKKQKIEFTAPVYQHQTQKARDTTRFLKKETEPGGLFLVRLTKGEEVKRLLVTRSSLIAEGWSLNGIVTGYAARSNGVPLSDVRLELCDSSGRVVDTAATTADGTVRFRSDEHRGVYLWAEESLGTALARVVHQNVAVPIASPGLLWTQGKYFEPGQDSIYLGLWWSDGELPLVEVVDAGGEPVEVSISPPERVGPFFQGRFAAPQRSGEYRVRFRQGTGSHESALVGASTFHVSRLAGQSGAPVVSLELGKLESGGYGGSYEWDGRGASLLGASARLVAQKTVRDGWERVRPGQPDLIPLSVVRKVSMLGGHYELQPLPPVQGRWNLVVEIFDRESPGAVVKRAELELGEEVVKLLGCELKRLSSSTSRARFRFRFTRSENNGRRALYCRLETRENDTWVIRESAEAGWTEETYRWDVTLPSHGSYRISVSDEPDGTPFAVWQNTLRGSADSGGQLELMPRPVSSGQRLSVVWPEVEDGTAVWLSLLTGREQVVQRRAADQEGGMGDILVPKARLGERELKVVVASLAPELRVRFESVKLNTDEFYQQVDADLLSFRGEPLTLTEQELEIDVPSLYRFGVAWWSHHDSESSTKAGGLVQLVDFVQSGQELANLPMAAPAVLTDTEHLPIKAPSEPGTYELRMLGLDDEGRVLFCRQSVQVSAQSKWEAVAPDWLRPGDTFAAGVRYSSDPEDLGKTGATTSVEDDSNLLPLGYQTTAALVDPGSIGDMLFSYRAPDFAAASETSVIHLVWELGVEGQAHRVEKELAPLPTAVQTETFREIALEPGRRRRLEVRIQGHWLAKLSMGEEGGALVYLDGDDREPQHVNLSKTSPREFAGQGTGTLELELLSGSTVKVEILELKPKPVNDSYSALGLYMLRQLETVGGAPVDSDDTDIAQSYLLAHYLVVPEEGVSGYLVAPLPGGMRAKGVWKRSGDELTPLHWTLGEGIVQAILPDLTEGEHQIVVLVDAHIGGDYFWPGSKIVGIDEEVLSSTISERVKIEWE